MPRPPSRFARMATVRAAVYLLTSGSEPPRYTTVPGRFESALVRPPPSPAGSTRGSIRFTGILAKMMDARVKPGQDPMQARSTWWYQCGLQTTNSRIGETDGSPLDRHHVDGTR